MTPSLCNNIENKLIERKYFSYANYPHLVVAEQDITISEYSKKDTKNVPFYGHYYCQTPDFAQGRDNTGLHFVLSP